MSEKKKGVAAAISAAVGVMCYGTSHAGDVVNWDLKDTNGDGLRSDFVFFEPPPGNGAQTFGFANEVGCKAATDGDICDPIAFDAGAIDTRVFATGFNFGGNGIFRPNITGNISATIDGPADGDGSNNTLTFLDMDWGGVFIGTQFYLAPDDITNCTGTPGCGTTAGSGGPNTGYLVESLTDNGDGIFGVVVRFVSTIKFPGTPFDGFETHWRFEGTMDTSLVGLPRVIVDIQIPGSGVQECAATGGTTVSLVADVLLLNGAELDSITWTIDGQPAGTGPAIQPFLGLGSHSISVTADAVAGQTGQDFATVEIVDTTAPDLDVAFIDKHSGQPVTSIPHSRIHRVIARIKADDVCDPDPVAQGVGGFSVNDGDVLKIKGRRGRVTLTTNKLELMATATDDSGNTTSGDAELTINDN